jgi:hypothetical protein
MGTVRGALVSFAVGGILLAQGPKSAAPRFPAPLKQALARIGKGESGFAEIHEVPGPRKVPRVCSVPLVPMRVGDPDRFTMRRLAPDASKHPMPKAELPVPPCEDDHR